LELGSDPDIPVYVVLEYQGCRKILVDHPVPNQHFCREFPRWWTHCCKAFICDLQLPLILFGNCMLFVLPPGGKASSGTLSPLTPIRNSTFILLTAAARLTASLRSVRSGILMTRSFWNCASFSTQPLDLRPQSDPFPVISSSKNNH
jgi:hypothetical protein